MTFQVKKRGKTYRLEGRYGERARRGSGERKRLRLSFGTLNHDAAGVLAGKIDRALAGGPTSTLWTELRPVLPPETFQCLAAIVGYVDDKKPELPKHTWADLPEKFAAWTLQRVALDRMRNSTRERYAQTSKAFGEFLKSRAIVNLDEITRAMVEDFKAWQLARVLGKKHSRGGRGVVLDAAILHRIFVYAIVECELITKNPVRLEGRPGDDPERGAQPFKSAELTKLRQAAGADIHAFLLLRWTGFRGFSAAVLHPTTSRSFSETRSKPSKSTTRHLCGNSENERGGSWSPVTGWNR
jgi:hypothetical protein